VRSARLIALALVGAAVLAFLLMRRSGTSVDPASPAAGSSMPEPAKPAVPGTPGAAANVPAGLDAAALASPQATVQTELRLLEAGEQELFRQTFLAHVQAQVTNEAFAACRRRVRQVPVRPDWEMAEAGATAGHRVVRVSMFGKSMTGFHEVDGRWLADALWCLPTGVP
jgi:hypothetical protein